VIVPTWRFVRGPAIVLLWLGAIYLGLCWIFWAYEPAFVFYQLQRPGIAPAKAGLNGFTEVSVRTEDGIDLYGWWGPPQPGHGAIVVFTGSGVSLIDYGGLLGDFAGHGFGVLGIDYRGNGASPGVPSEKAWRRDARAAFDFVRREAPQAKIALYGQSMGSGFAVGLALERPAVGVLIDSGYASVVRLFQRGGLPLVHVPFPARLLMTDTIDSEAIVGRLRVPLFVIHGTEDWAIPVGEARRLYTAANEPKELIEVVGAGHAAVWFGPQRERALAALARWTAPEPAEAGRAPR
jgi:alpha-beta hydrolase superfamily lysophospholipase